MPGRGIVLYDFLQLCGGAERVTATLAMALPSVDLCVGSAEPGKTDALGLNGLKVLDLGAGGRSAPSRALNAMRVFRRRTRFLVAYDWVLYSGSYAPVAVHNHPEGRNLYYCHTIPRFVYDLKSYYLDGLPPWQRPALRALIAYVRPRFEAAVQRMDVIIANSENVRRRVKRHLGWDAVVINPPCDVAGYRWSTQGDYYLSTARLERYKRVDLVIDAFRLLPQKKLVVASGGSDFSRLKRLAAGARNIEFAGWQDETRMRELVGRAIATIYVPKDEDFGISPVESMAAGKPVIGVAEGGLLETVVHGGTGLLVPGNPTVADVVAAVETLSPGGAAQMRDACEARAQRFSKENFVANMRAVLGT